MHILIAEDDSLIQEMTRLLMKSWGFEFDLVSDGQEAVDLATTNEGKYDLCLMDIDMPIMNGCDATKMIRRQVRYFPIMALSAHSAVNHSYWKLGMDDCLSKPYNLNQLYDKINELTLKLETLYLNQNKLHLEKEIPMDQEELRELIELKKKGLTKLKLVGTNQTFVVHRNIQNKISFDLIGEGKELSEFIDRSEKEPGRCHLYKANLHVTKDLLIPNELENAIEEEDKIAIKFNHVTNKKLPSKE